MNTNLLIASFLLITLLFSGCSDPPQKSLSAVNKYESGDNEDVHQRPSNTSGKLHGVIPHDTEDNFLLMEPYRSEPADIVIPETNSISADTLAEKAKSVSVGLGSSIGPWIKYSVVNYICNISALNGHGIYSNRSVVVDVDTFNKIRALYLSDAF